MERIKQALERARAERENLDTAPAGGLSTGEDATPDTQSTPPAETSAEARQSVNKDGEVNVTYTRTRTFKHQLSVLRRNRIVSVADPSAPATTAYKMLRTRVLQQLRREGWNSLAVTSPNEGEGKTLTAVNLAISIAREVSSTVLLVDADLLRPAVHRCFGYAPTVGLVDHLMHDAPIDEILVNPGIERLVIIPGGKPVMNSSELLSSPRMLRFVEEVKARYTSRIIIFDLPPVLSADDALGFAPYVDAALLVLKDGKTKQNEVVRALEFLSSTNIIGTVLNGSEEDQAVYGYR
jgi:protein-tyrosine kinase